MRLKLKLEVDKTHNLLPLNYQYPISAWIYNVLGRADPKYADWLHIHGHKIDNKHFKLFTFSQLFPGKYERLNDRLKILNTESFLYISFHIDKSLENFIIGLFQNQEIHIADQKSKAIFNIRTIEILPVPELSKDTLFGCLSPICLSKTVIYNHKKSSQYLSPHDPEYQDYFFNNLVFKYLAAHPDDGKMKEKFKYDKLIGIEFLSTPQSRLITIKEGREEETKIRGFSFQFRIQAPEKLIQFGYEAGLGEKNSLGFGCVDVINN